jgi:hypothetical protein
LAKWIQRRRFFKNQPIKNLNIKIVDIGGIVDPHWFKLSLGDR